MTDTEYAPARDGQETLVESRLRWIVDVLVGGGRAADFDPAAHFVPAFLDKHPGGLDALLDAWRELGPFTVESYTPLAHKGWTTLAGRDGERHTLAITIDSSGLIRRMDVEREVFRRVPRNFADVDEFLTRSDIVSRALVCRRAGDGWETLYERVPDELMPTGSAFKLYVFLALARAVRDGDVSWDDEVVVRPPQRSLPTGEMQDLPDGTRVSLFETAYRMFARSDNTASDLIVHHVGRAALHRAVAESGHHDPDVLTPFVTSRELFEIGWGEPGLLDAWHRADRAGRERLLERIDGPLTTRIADLTEPAYDRGLDWFMSARDVRDALAAAWAEVRRDPTGKLREIIEAYPGVQMDRELWPESLFKGGSTPGVVMFCWLLVDRAGVEHVVVLLQRADRVGILRDGLPLRRLGDLIMHSLLA